MSYYGFRPYVPVAKRRAIAARELEKLRKKGRKVSPVVLEGRTIARTFWGKSWCENLERYSDFENRLPRGRTYVRNGSVVDLQIERGQVRYRHHPTVALGSDLQGLPGLSHVAGRIASGKDFQECDGACVPRGRRTLSEPP